MVFLTSLDILDTGYLTKAKNTTRLATADIANAGVAFRLKGVEFDIQSSCNLDKSATPGKFTTPTVPLISINPRELTIRVVFNRFNTSTSNYFAVNDMSYIYELVRLAETKGIKAIYYPVDTSATGDTRGMANQILYQLGTADTTEPQTSISISLWNGSAEATGKNLTNVKYIPCRIESVKFPQRGDNIIEVVITAVWSI
jgi:hypothetical protein